MYFPSKAEQMSITTEFSLGANFHFKQTILVFWTTFTQKGYFPSEAGQTDITIQFCKFGLV